MADPITASNVTYTVQERGVTKTGVKNVVKIAFGNSTLEYRTATGIPLTAGKLGCPNHIRSLSFVESVMTSGYVWDYDVSVGKLMGFIGNYDSATDDVLIEIANATAIPAQEVWVEVEGW